MHKKNLHHVCRIDPWLGGCNLSLLCEVHIFLGNSLLVMMLTTDHVKNDDDDDDDGFLMGFRSILQFTLFMAVVVAPYVVPYVNMRLDMDALRGLCICSAE